MQFISSIEALSQLVASNSREPILIGGKLVLLSHNRADAADISSLTDRYVAQPPRLASRKSFFDKDKRNLYVSIDKQAVEMILGYKGQVSLSADQYLAYGLAQRKNVIVIGGGDSSVDGEANLEGFVFTDQSLVDTFEKNAHLSGYMLDIVLEDIVREYPNHEIHWCEPLAPMPDCDIKKSSRYVDGGNEAIKSLVKRKFYSRKQSEEESWGVIPAIAVGFLGVAIFTGATGYQWKQLSSERDEYHREIVGYESAYENSTHSLELLRHRDFLMSEQSEGASRVELLDNLIVKVSLIQGILIHQIQVIDSDDQSLAGGASTDDLFILDVSIPKVEQGAREQAEKLVSEINRQLGMTVRVISHTSLSKNHGGTSQEFWRYTLGGSQ